LSELTKRILFGVPAAAFFLYLVWTGGIAFEIFTAGIAMMIVIETVRLFQKMEYSAIMIAAFLLGLFLWTISYQPFWMVLIISLAILLVTVWSLISGNRALSSRWLATLFCGFYAPLGMFFFNEVRKMDPDFAGFWFAFALILMIWGNDMFAYFGGRSFGKRPLAPKISPNKTWEGFWFGFAGALIGLLIVYTVADPFPLNFLNTLPMVVLISIFGPAGDLLESRLKRTAGVKDSSNLLPGHGGFFDRFDALILCAPIVYLYLYIIY
jgi:phosphatidate cytidylyltransferase